jgi:signal peptidase I
MTDSVERDTSVDASQSHIKRFLSALLIALVIVVFSSFWAWLLAHRVFSVPSGSMTPTLQEGDYLWPSTLSYGLSRETYPFSLPLGDMRLFASTPRRGDVVAFRRPAHDDIYFKRVIGLPGDQIQLKKGRLYINGNMVEREFVADADDDELSEADASAPIYKETLPEGRSYLIQEIEGDEGYYDNTAVFIVPAGSYFVLGDNRDNSSDSRIDAAQNGVGMVPYENFIARLDRILFSTNSPDRTFKSVR